MLGLQNLFNKFSCSNNKKDPAGNTALYRAVKNGSLNEVKLLLKKGADPNISNAHHLTPLHQAAYWGEVEMVDLLLKYGANPNADNSKGWTALHSAAVAGGMRTRKEIIELLLAKGASPDTPDKNGWTPKDYMKLWEENTSAAEKLKQYLSLLAGQEAPPSAIKKPSKDHTPKH